MEHSNLPRLDDSAYLGRSYVHWSFTIKNRKTGWLTPKFHQAFREVMIHALGRYGAVCPVYCLMRDHVHLVLIGWSDSCDQKTMTRFIRKQLKASLLEYGCEWQKQSFDNVLREKDRHRDAFQKVVGYVLDNPVRANYVDRWEDWKCCDSIIPGYPEVAIRDEDFWDRFWRIYYSKE